MAQSSCTISANAKRLLLLNGGNCNANDRILGGLGNDTLTGEIGQDTFLFLTAPHSAANRDTITDFSAADDVIQLDNAVYALLTATGTLAANLFKNPTFGGPQDADDVILNNDTTGAIYYDTNRLATGGIVHFATLTVGPSVTKADFVIV